MTVSGRRWWLLMLTGMCLPTRLVAPTLPDNFDVDQSDGTDNYYSRLSNFEADPELPSDYHGHRPDGRRHFAGCHGDYQCCSLWMKSPEFRNGCSHHNHPSDPLECRRGCWTDYPEDGQKGGATDAAVEQDTGYLLGYVTQREGRLRFSLEGRDAGKFKLTGTARLGMRTVEFIDLPDFEKSRRPRRQQYL